MTKDFVEYQLTVQWRDLTRVLLQEKKDNAMAYQMLGFIQGMME